MFVLSGSEEILEVIRARRETRDRLMLQELIPMLNELRRVVNTWIDGEFTDLEDEISHIDNFAPRDSASERINRFRIELGQIRNDQLPKALKELDDLIEYIQKQKFKTAEEANETLRSKINPIISLLFNLSRARERLDGMADMIPLPALPRIEEYRGSNEE